MPKQTGSIDLSSQKQAHDDASKTATNYIYASSDGIKVANASPQSATTYQLQQSDNTRFIIGGNLKSKISGNGFEVFSTNTTGGNDKYRSRIGYYGENGSIIGKAYSSHILISDDSFKMQQGDGTSIFSIDIDENEDKTYAINEVYEANNSTRLQLDSGEYGTVTFYRLTDYDPLTSEFTKTGDYKYVWHYTDDNVWYEVGSGDVRLMDNDDPDWDNIGPQIPVSPSHGFIDPYTAVDAGGQDFIKNYGSKTVEVVYASVSERVSAKTTIGKAYVNGASDNESRMELNYRSLKLFTRENLAYLHISDLRDADGSIKEYFVGDGVQTRFLIQFYKGYTPQSPQVFCTVTVDGVNQSGNYHIENNYEYHTVVFNTAPADGANIVVHSTGIARSIAYTLGLRNTDSDDYVIGKFSYALGYRVIASAPYSYADGYETTASGMLSRAHGDNTIASGYRATAEGDHTVASGDSSHAQGTYSKAIGYNSCAFNENTIASSSDQIAIGRSNVQDDSNSLAVIIGNGNSSGRSNALTVDWNGHIVTKADPSSNKKISSTAPSSNIVLAETVNKDADGNQIGYSQITFTTSNVVQRSFVVQRGSTTNGLWLGINSSGARTVGFSDSGIWRNALFGVSNGVVPASLGGTGQTSLQATRTAMGLGNTLGAVPIAAGGSGQTGTVNTDITMSSGASASAYNVRKWGNVVTLFLYNVKFTASVADGNSHDIGTVPAGYRPANACYAQVASSTLSGLAYVRCTSAGELKFTNQSGAQLAASKTFSATLTYVIG